MTTDGVYDRWVRYTFCSRYTDVCHFAVALKHMTIGQRKVILTQSRCQVPPRPLSRLYLRNKAAYDSFVYYQDPASGLPVGKSVKSLGESTEHYTSSPITIGLISSLARMALYEDYESVQNERDEGIRKELSTALQTYHPVALDYSSILNTGYDDLLWSQLAPNIPPAPRTALAIRHQLSKAKQSLTRPLYYPKISKKTIGKVAKRNARYTYGGAQAVIETPETIGDIEQIYMRTGFKISGPVEMRSAWKYNDLKPRIYYASGPSSHHASKVIQLIFNVLVDSLENTHIFLRHRPSFIGSLDEAVLFVYDYASLTSNLHEIRNFTARLADFFQDVMITVVDSHHGPSKQSVGDILRSYNAECNISPDFDVSELLELNEIMLSHNCGMLGVPGNISSCTLWHGIHLAMILDSLSSCKVVGDDAIGKLLLDQGFTRITLLEALQNIGKVSASKTEFGKQG